MTKYVFSGLPTHYLVQKGKIAERNVLVIEQKETVDVSSLAELQAEFDAYCARLSGAGKQCYRVDAALVESRGARAFRGFKAATRRDGPLNRVVNKDTAIAKAKTKSA